MRTIWVLVVCIATACGGALWLRHDHALSEKTEWQEARKPRSKYQIGYTVVSASKRGEWSYVDMTSESTYVTLHSRELDVVFPGTGLVDKLRPGDAVIVTVEFVGGAR